jgi:hypothetical protein
MKRIDAPDSDRQWRVSAVPIVEKQEVKVVGLSTNG